MGGIDFNECNISSFQEGPYPLKAWPVPELVGAQQTLLNKWTNKQAPKSWYFFFSTFQSVLSILIIYTHTFKILFFSWIFLPPCKRLPELPSRLIMSTCHLFSVHVPRAELPLSVDDHLPGSWSPRPWELRCVGSTAEFLSPFSSSPDGHLLPLWAVSLDTALPWWRP